MYVEDRFYFDLVNDLKDISAQLKSVFQEDNSLTEKVNQLYTKMSGVIIHDVQTPGDWETVIKDYQR